MAIKRNYELTMDNRTGGGYAMKKTATPKGTGYTRTATSKSTGQKTTTSGTFTRSTSNDYWGDSSKATKQKKKR